MNNNLTSTDEDLGFFAGPSQVLVQNSEDESHNVHATVNAQLVCSSTSGIGNDAQSPLHLNQQNSQQARMSMAAHTIRASCAAKINFFLQGIANFALWSTLLNTLDYFEDVYRDADYHIAYTLPVPYFVGVASTAVFMLRIQHVLTYQQRVGVSLVVNILVLAGLALASELLAGSAGFAITVVLLFVGGAFSQIFFASQVGCASKSGSVYLIAFNLGTACSLLVLALLRIGSLLIYDALDTGSDEESQTHFSEVLSRSTVLFFGTAAGVNVAALVAHAMFLRSRQFRYLQEVETANLNSITSFAFDEVSMYQVDFGPLRERADTDSAPQSTYDNIVTRNPNATVPSSLRQHLVDVFKMVYPLPVFMGVTCAQTLMMFPGVTLTARDAEHVEFTWNCVLFIMTYGVFNAIAKFMSRYRYMYSRKCVYYTVLLRFVVFAYFIAALVTPETAVFKSLPLETLVVIIFSFTDGFCVAALFLYAADEGVSRAEKEQAGFAMVLSYVIGQMVGTFLALPFTSLN